MRRQSAKAQHPLRKRVQTWEGRRKQSSDLLWAGTSWEWNCTCKPSSAGLKCCAGGLSPIPLCRRAGKHAALLLSAEKSRSGG